MTTRVGEVAWVLAYRDDLDADFARFFRCDLLDLDGPRLFTRAQRVSAYGGVMTLRLAEQDRDEVEPDDLPPLPEGAQVVPLDALSGMIERG